MSDGLRAVPSDEEPREFDKPRIERAVREILEAIGEDPDRDGLQFTPRRIADMYEEIFSGMREDPRCHVITCPLPHPEHHDGCASLAGIFDCEDSP